MALTWKELREDLHLTEEEEAAIRLERELIQTIVQIREERGLTQAQVAELCDMKQPMVARIERMTHSPQINSLLKMLVPLGYTLKIVPMEPTKE